MIKEAVFYQLTYKKVPLNSSADLCAAVAQSCASLYSVQYLPCVNSCWFCLALICIFWVVVFVIKSIGGADVFKMWHFLAQLGSFKKGLKKPFSCSGMLER